MFMKTKANRRSALSRGAERVPYLWLDTGGECYQPQRGVLTKPRPTAWVKMPSRSLAALKGRHRGYSPLRSHPSPCLAKAYFALSGLATRTRDVFRPRPLAWAVLGRPYRARWGVGNARTRGVQQKIWDTLSPSGGGWSKGVGIATKADGTKPECCRKQKAEGFATGIRRAGSEGQTWLLKLEGRSSIRDGCRPGDGPV